MRVLSLIFFIAFLFSACGFNKSFYPTKYSRFPKRIEEHGRVLTITGNNYQPIFTDSVGDTINLLYTIQSVLFKSSDGNTLNGWLIKPKHQPIVATILHLHGNAGSVLDAFDMLPLVKKGFQTFTFDYSGYGFSTGVANRDNLLSDATSAVDYLKNRPDIKDTRLIIYGMSIGGHLAAAVASRKQSDISGLVIEGAFSSHKDIANQQFPIIGSVITKGGYPAYKEIRNYYKPLLIIHSTEDEVVPFKEGKKIFDNANQPKEFYEIKHPHIAGLRFYSDEIAKKIKVMVSDSVKVNK